MPKLNIEMQFVVHGDGYKYRIREHPDFPGVDQFGDGGVVVEYCDQAVNDQDKYEDRITISPDCINGLIEALQKFKQ